MTKRDLTEEAAYTYSKIVLRNKPNQTVEILDKLK